MKRKTRLVRGKELVRRLMVFGFVEVGEGGGKKNGESVRRRWRQMRERVFVVSPVRGVMAAATFFDDWAISW
ncbi:hypothetical protein H5410_006355 [Solanum commersonii]|uniref:Uncharacterized protein n=1 Tax=Solanum commersonii TaxID=4109 RepID=A0A9J6A9H5_SOLCO|nr:hypothetical protein H5410_006355 [Solanum commersonii]